jgi:hypothetical protein
LRDRTSYPENLERLLRWVFDKPLHVRPDLGDPPGFVAQSEANVALATTSRARRAVEALRAGQRHAIPLTEEYLTYLAAPGLLGFNELASKP